MSATQLNAEEFWAWVVANERKLREASNANDPVLDDLLRQLHAYCSDLYFEIGGVVDGATELIITAEGNSSYFDAVRRLVELAPALPGWKFVAFKPPHGFAFVTKHGRATINAAKAWFLVLTSASRPDLLGLRIACDEYTPDAHDDFLFGARIAIQAGLGEVSAARDVQHVEVGRTPDSPAADGYIALRELPKYLAWRAKSRKS